MFRFFNRRRTLRTTAPAPRPVPGWACDDLEPLPQLFSPLITEMMATCCHTKHLAGLAQKESSAAEYQLVARSIVQHVLEGWQNQTDGRGTIDDLLLEPRISHPADNPTTRLPGFPVAWEHPRAS